MERFRRVPGGTGHCVPCMGIIEYTFAGISAVIGKAVVQRRWVRQEDLVHYAMHAQIDERHAEEFFAVIEQSWDNPSRRLPRTSDSLRNHFLHVWRFTGSHNRGLEIQSAYARSDY